MIRRTAQPRRVGGWRAALCVVGALFIAPNLYAAQVTGIRTYTGHEYTRVVFDISAHVNFTMGTLSNPERVYVDIADADLTAAAITTGQVSAGSPIVAIRPCAVMGQGVRCTIELSVRTRPKSFLLAPIAPHGHRLVLDLYPASSRASAATSPATSPAKRVVTSGARTNGAPVVVSQPSHVANAPAAVAIETAMPRSVAGADTVAKSSAVGGVAAVAVPANAVKASGSTAITQQDASDATRVVAKRGEPNISASAPLDVAAGTTPVAGPRPPTMPPTGTAAATSQAVASAATLPPLGSTKPAPSTAGAKQTIGSRATDQQAGTASTTATPTTTVPKVVPIAGTLGTRSQAPSGSAAPVPPSSAVLAAPSGAAPALPLSAALAPPLGAAPAAGRSGAAETASKSSALTTKPSGAAAADVRAASAAESAKTRPAAASAGKARGRNVVVAVDAGHGGEDPGAIGADGLREKDVVLAIARRLAELINAEPGFRAVLIRDGDYYIPLRERTRKARDAGAHFFVSVHADAHQNREARGASVYALSERGATSETAKWLAQRENSSDLVGGVSLEDKDKLLAEVLLDLSMTASLAESLEMGSHVLGNLRGVTRLHSRHVEQAGFVVLKSPDIPSILVETGYISNASEAKLLSSDAHRREIADAVFEGVRAQALAKPPRGTVIANRNHAPMVERDAVAQAAARPASMQGVTTQREALHGEAVHSAAVHSAATRPDSMKAAPASYRVSAGDTLAAVATQHGVSLRALMELNDLASDSVQIGQILRIPVRLANRIIEPMAAHQ